MEILGYCSDGQRKRIKEIETLFTKMELVLFKVEFFNEWIEKFYVKSGNGDVFQISACGNKVDGAWLNVEEIQA